MPVLYLALCSVLYSFQFLFNKHYQLRTDGSANSSFWMMLTTSLTAAVLTAPFAAANFHPDTASILVALGNAVFFGGSLIISIPAMKRGDLSTFTVFFLTGSVVIPFVYGVFLLGEEVSAAKIAGIIIVLLSLAPDVIASAREKKRDSKSKDGNKTVFIILCFLGFLFNGSATIMVKMLYVLTPDADGMVFIFLSSLFRVAAVVPVILIFAALKYRRKRRKTAGAADISGKTGAVSTSEITAQSPPRASYIESVFSGIGKKFAPRAIAAACLMGALYAVSNTSGTVFSLECAKVMDSSIQFPVMNAAIIIGTTLISIFILREKPRRSNFAGVLLALTGIVVFSL